MTGTLQPTYDPMLVLLSMGVATWASFVSLHVAGRIWRSEGRARMAWIVAAAQRSGGRHDPRHSRPSFGAPDAPRDMERDKRGPGRDAHRQEDEHRIVGRLECAGHSGISGQRKCDGKHTGQILKRALRSAHRVSGMVKIG